MGTGVFGAAGAGVLMELWQRQMEPYAVCALGSGAWPAALFASGCDSAQMELACRQAQRMGRRMIRKAPGGILGKKAALYTAEGVERLLQAQTRGRLLALCPRRVIFPVRSMRGGNVVFTSRSYMAGDGRLPVTQASAAFAARAVMGMPPFLEPIQWMGTPLLPVNDDALAAKLLFASGAQRVLIVDMSSDDGYRSDGLLLASACMEKGKALDIPGTVRLAVRIPAYICSLSFDRITECMELGRKAAARELDQLLPELGMASCRVLPFRKAIHPRSL